MKEIDIHLYIAKRANEHGINLVFREKDVDAYVRSTIIETISKETALNFTSTEWERFFQRVVHLSIRNFWLLPPPNTVRPHVVIRARTFNEIEEVQ